MAGEGPPRGEPDKELGTEATLDASGVGTSARTPEPEPRPDSRQPLTPAHTGPGAASGWKADDLPMVDPERYLIGKEFARGGMGRIMSARDRRLGRNVALKELLRNEADPSARFIREALVTARLQHPAIVPVYEAGRWPTGEPFYAMKLVSGRPLVDVIADMTTMEERLALLPNVASVAEAIAYAHSEEIVHRDLKPANILVGEFGETVVIDWGLAKDLREAAERPPSRPRSAADNDTESDEPSVDGQTIEGSVMGTPAYMAPEQARGETVGAAADVYALGAILYHLLCGEAPFVGRSVDEILDRVVRGGPVPLEKRAPAVPRDLRAIVTKAMQRDPLERYPTARELAEDLRRFQTGQLIGAHDYSTLDRVRLWVRRNRMPVLVVGLLLAALAGTAVLSVRRILGESRAADAARKQAERKSDELTLLQASSLLERDPTAALAWLRKLSPLSPGWSTARMIAADALSRGVARDVLRGHQGAVRGLGWALDGRAVVSMGDDRTARVWELATGRPRVLGGELALSVAALSPDGKQLVSASNRRDAPDLTVWELGKGTPRRIAAHDDVVRHLAWAPGGRRVLAVGSAVAIWDTEALAGSDAGARRVLAGAPRVVTAAGWSADGKRVVVGGQDGTVVSWHDGGDAQVLGLHLGPVLALAAAPDGARVATAGGDGVKLWQDGGAPLAASEVGEVRTLAWSADGKTLAIGSRDGTVWAWKLPAAPRRMGAHAEAVQELAFAPDNHRLVSASSDRAVRLWDLDADEVRVLGGHEGPVLHVAWNSDGTRLASADQDGSVRVWDTAQPSGRALRGHTSMVTALVAAPEGRTLASASTDRTVRLWNLASGSGRVVLEHAGPLRALAMSADGRQVAAGGDDGVVGLWSPNRDVRKLLGHVGAVLALAFSADGTLLVSAGADGIIRSWTVASGDVRELGRQDGQITQLVFSPDQSVLASLARTAAGSGSIKLWSTSSDKVRTQKLDRAATRIAISPGGRLLAASGESGTIVLWDLLDTGTAALRGHEDAVRDLAFAPESQQVASGGNDKTVRLWDLRTGRGRVLGSHGAPVLRVVFAADGRRLLSASEDGTLRLWDLVGGQSRALRGNASAITSAVFSADGTRVLSGAADGAVRIFNDDLPVAPRALLAWLDSATRVAIDAANVPATQPK